MKPYSISTTADLPEISALWPRAVAVVFHLDNDGNPVSAHAFETLMAAGDYAARTFPEHQPQKPAGHVVDYPVLTAV